MTSPLQITWNQANAEAHFAKHGVRFDYAARVFLDTAHVDLDASRDADGEARRKAVGMIEGKLFVVVYNLRGDTRRIISARRANAKETKAYG